MAVAVTELSNDPRDKLRAAIHHIAPDADDDLGEVYHEACRQWIAEVTEGERDIVATALLAYGGNGKGDVRKMLSQLPPARDSRCDCWNSGDREIWPRPRCGREICIDDQLGMSAPVHY